MRCGKASGAGQVVEIDRLPTSRAGIGNRRLVRFYAVADDEQQEGAALDSLLGEGVPVAFEVPNLRADFRIGQPKAARL